MESAGTWNRTLTWKDSSATLDSSSLYTGHFGEQI